MLYCTTFLHTATTMTMDHLHLNLHLYHHHHHHHHHQDGFIMKHKCEMFCDACRQEEQSQARGSSTRPQHAHVSCCFLNLLLVASCAFTGSDPLDLRCVTELCACPGRGHPLPGNPWKRPSSARQLPPCGPHPQAVDRGHLARICCDPTLMMDTTSLHVFTQEQALLLTTTTDYCY